MNSSFITSKPGFVYYSIKTSSEYFVYNIPCKQRLLLSADNLANSLDPDQDRHYVGPDLDPNHLPL